MSDKKSLTDKLTNFLFGEPVPVLNEAELAAIHSLDTKLDKLLARLDGQQENDAQSGRSSLELDPPALDDLSEQVRKLAKTQFKTNTLQETQLTQQQEALASLQKSVEQQEKSLAELSQQAVEAAQLDLLKGLLPVLDSLDAAFESGRRQVLKRPMPVETRQAIIAWLDGIRLARMRLLDLLKTYEVSPIPTTGERFDPNRHVAVATDSTGSAPDGAIVGEDRRGYMTPNKVIRFAEVVVARSD